MNINEYLDEAKAILHTDSAVARAIGLQYKELWAVRKGKRNPNEEVCTRLALIIDREPMEIIACVNLAAAKSDSSRDFWKGFISQHWLAIFAAALLPIFAFYGSDDSVTFGLIASAGANLPTIAHHNQPLCEVLLFLFVALPCITALCRGFALWTGNLPYRSTSQCPSRL